MLSARFGLRHFHRGNHSIKILIRYALPKVHYMKSNDVINTLEIQSCCVSQTAGATSPSLLSLSQSSRENMEILRYPHRQCRHHRRSSTMSNEYPLPSNILLPNFQSRVYELEDITNYRRLNKNDLHKDLWPLLAQSVASPSYRIDEQIVKAELSNRLLELSLREVNSYRVYLTQWLKETSETHDTNDGCLKRNESHSSELSDIDHKSFSPTEFWKNAPHPTKEMFNLVFSSWKNVILSITSSSSLNMNSVHAIEKMESAAQHVSSLLRIMEHECDADISFVHTYNSLVNKSKYDTISSGAALPDVRTYGEVMSTWSQCVSQSIFRQSRKNDRDANFRVDRNCFQKLVQLESSAIKVIMNLIESMEEGLYETITTSHETSHEFEAGRVKTHDVDVLNESIAWKRPPPDRICYNIALSTMARRNNPSLHEMRLVLQRMMERVQYELDHSGTNSQNEGTNNLPHRDIDSPALSLFPNEASYNALIEAHANRSALLASDKNKQKCSESNKSSQSQRQHPSVHRRPSQNVKDTSRVDALSTSEEESILGEQILDEMCRTVTIPVRPNIWSYNSIIKAWIDAGSDRALQRAVLILRSLIMNNTKFKESESEGENYLRYDEDLLHSFLGENKSMEGDLDVNYLECQRRIKPRSTQVNELSERNTDSSLGHLSQDHLGAPSFAVGLAGRLHRFDSACKDRRLPIKAKPRQSNKDFEISTGMANRLSLMTAIHINENTGTNNPVSDIIGPLPHIEPNVTPDLKTFKITINALEHHGFKKSAELAEEILEALEKYYPHLDPDIAIYNSVINSWSMAGKQSNDTIFSKYAANRALELMLKISKDRNDRYFLPPRPNENTFLLVINAWAHAAAIALTHGKIHESENAAEQAEAILDQLQEHPLQNQYTRMACFGSVARVLAGLSGKSAKNGYAARAQTMLEKMAEISDGLQLDLITVNAVLDAWVRDIAMISPVEGADEVISRLSNMQDILMKMNKSGHHNSYYVNPDTSSFNHVIRACYAPWASSKIAGEDWGPRKAWDVALETYSLMSKGYNNIVQPDAHTYLHMFKAIKFLIRPKAALITCSKKFDAFKILFDNCCKEGHLSKTSFWVIHSIFQQEPMYLDLLLLHMANHNSLDKEKICNMSADDLFTYLPTTWSQNGQKIKALNMYKY